MKVKNISARLHHIGNVTILPGAVVDIPDEYSNSINKKELLEVKEEIVTKIEKKQEKKLNDIA